MKQFEFPIKVHSTFLSETVDCVCMQTMVSDSVHKLLNGFKVYEQGVEQFFKFTMPALACLIMVSGWDTCGWQT